MHLNQRPELAAAGLRDEPGAEPAFLRWPADRAERERLALAGRARILLISATGPPPELWDELEDWVRHPVDPTELMARAATVRARALRLARRPRFDDEGVLWSNDRWLSLTGAQYDVARLLVEQFGNVVPSDEVNRALDAGGWRSADAGQRVVLGRLRRQFTTIGLSLHQIRGRGPMLLLDEAGEPVANAQAARAIRHRRSSVSRGDEETGA